MKLYFLLVLLPLTLSITYCDHCVRLVQNNFEDTQLLESNYCNGDAACENLIRQIAYRYPSTQNLLNPCSRDPFQLECYSYGWKICSEIIGDACQQSPVVKPLLFKEKEQHRSQPEMQFSQYQVDGMQNYKRLKEELVMQKQKFFELYTKLEKLESEIQMQVQNFIYNRLEPIIKTFCLSYTYKMSDLLEIIEHEDDPLLPEVQEVQQYRQFVRYNSLQLLGEFIRQIRFLLFQTTVYLLTVISIQVAIGISCLI